MMHRLFGFLVLATFTAGPALGAPCLRACLHGEGSAIAESGCHRSAAPQHRLVNVHDCSSHGAPIAVAAKRLEPVSPFVLASAIAGFPVGLVATARPVPPRDAFALSPPPVLFLNPLRI